MKTKQLRDRIVKLLKGGWFYRYEIAMDEEGVLKRQKQEFWVEPRARSTGEIQELLNTVSRHGTTTQQLGNILSKDKRFVKIGYTRKKGSRYGSYSTCLWDLTDRHPEEVIEIVAAGYLE